MARTNHQLVTEWETEHGKQFPCWATVWSYDAYGEAWEAVRWDTVSGFYESERKKEQGLAAWDFQYEPMVALPTDIPPVWGDGIALKREVPQKSA